MAIQKEMQAQCGRRAGFAACYGTFALNGMLALTVGALLPYIRDSYALGYAYAGQLVSLHSFGNLCASFLAGFLPLFLGRRKSVILFSTCYALAFLMILSTGQPAILAAAFFMSGLARGSVSNFNNAEMNLLAPGKGWALNALHASFAIGAFLAPLLVLLCAQILHNWKLMCWLLVIFGVIEVLIFISMPLSVDQLERKANNKNMDFLHRREFWFTISILFFYLCAEQGVIGWMVTYFKDTEIMSAGYAQTMASVLWLLILFGRLTAAWLCTKVDPQCLLVLMSSGMVGFFILVLLGRSLPVITFGIAGFGFSMAGVYPTRVSIIGDMMKEYPISWSVILPIATMGSILMPSVIGAVAEHAGLYMGISTISIAVVSTLVMTVMSLCLEKKN